MSLVEAGGTVVDDSVAVLPTLSVDATRTTNDDVAPAIAVELSHSGATVR